MLDPRNKTTEKVENHQVVIKNPNVTKKPLIPSTSVVGPGALAFFQIGILCAPHVPFSPGNYVWTVGVTENLRTELFCVAPPIQTFFCFSRWKDAAFNDTLSR